MKLDPVYFRTPFAHRGLWNALHPENSISAIKSAVEAGYGVEFDLQMSRDGIAVVFHDDTLDRMTEKSGFVADFSSHELSGVQLKDSQDCIPTFREVLDVVDGRVPMLIELKDQSKRPGGTLGPLERAVSADLSDYAGPKAVMSFHPGMVTNLQKFAADVPRGLVGMDFSKEGLPQAITEHLNGYSAFEPSQSSFVSHDVESLGMDSVARLKSQGTPVFCWTVRSKSQELEAREVADNITFEGYLADKGTWHR